ncbi:MAG TPA: FAD-dependent oxidoreductase, partial [Thermoanaerobaculia bacterium]|nr:FAD-dependent oxidoreductase [Thermoanaerobaculia bacterium]
MRLGIDDFEYGDLRHHAGLVRLAGSFDRFVEARDGALFSRFDSYRQAVQNGIAGGGLEAPEESALLIAVSRELSLFLTRLFQIDPNVHGLVVRAQRDAQVARFKKEFVSKRVAKVQEASLDENRFSNREAAARLLIRTVHGAPERDPEFALAVTANRLLDLERDYPRTGNLAPGAEARAALAQLQEQLRMQGPELLPAAALQFEPVDSPEGRTRQAAAVHTLVDLLIEWCALAWRKGAFDGWTSFRLPRPLVFNRLVETAEYDSVRFAGDPRHLRKRDGFKLTDPRFSPREIADEAAYCIYCHERKKDSCSRGFVEKSGTFKPNPLGVPLEGCPLDEKIGEMNVLRSEGDSIAGLAMVMIDNPMCPGTGHRICNDCMRSCIFQKQEPVNIPQIETGVLTDVLFLPWGFEIYSLLTMWNPVNVRRPVALPYNGRNVLVVGLGPAGYTLAHYLANEGFGVVGIDGLKIEPLPKELIEEPIRDARALWDDLDTRVLAGFGGVSEYGITVRWDKNFLKVIRIALERKRNIRFYGGVRFGGTISISDAFDNLQFDHIAIAAGAGTPTIVRLKNNLIRGIRKASDFLMALQLTGAFKSESMANLQVRLPAVVIGGGLTAIDTATELFAYYPVQVEKILERYEALSLEFGEEHVRAGYDPEERATLDEFLAHGRAVRKERARAAEAGSLPDFLSLVRGWGGVTIAYRKSILDSPAYRLNYEEVAKAFEEGIAYADNLSPVEAVADASGHLASMIFEKQVVEDGRWKDSGEIVELPARTAMIAAGTSPNVIYEKEHRGTFKLDKYGQFFQSFAAVVPSGSTTTPVMLSRGDGEASQDAQRSHSEILRRAEPVLSEPAGRVERPPQDDGDVNRSGDEGSSSLGDSSPSSRLRMTPTPELIEVDANHETGFFTSYQHPSDRSKLITFYGDNHPRYAGNVVKAMASARDGYRHVLSLFSEQLMGLDRSDAAQEQRDASWKAMTARLDDSLLATVHEVRRLTPTIVEVIVRAPMASRRFEPGQFFRLQNYETHARAVNGTRLVMEGIALTGAWTDPDRGLLSLIILEMGGS